jgi:hypothetical protein
MHTLHVVTGHAGDCDGVTSWPVHAYADAATAERHRALAQAWCDKVEATFEKAGDDILSALAASDIQHPFDPSYAPDSTRTHYSVETIQAGPVNLDESLIETWSLRAPTLADIAACADILMTDRSTPREQVIRYELLKEQVDPDGTFDDMAAWQAVAIRLPEEEPDPVPRSLGKIWGHGIPSMPDSEGGATD